MKYIQHGWQRRQSILQQGVVLVAALLLASAALLANDGGESVGVSASTGLQPQKDTASPLAGVREMAPRHIAVPAGGNRGHESEKRSEIADKLRRQGDIAWHAGDDRRAGVLYRQSWAVMPDVPLLSATDLKRWEIVERLQREGDVAWHAGDVNRAAWLYHQRQVVLP